LHGRKDLRQALPELIKLLLLHRKITAQPGSIFATGECGTAEVDRSLRREFRVNDALGVILLCSAHGHLLKLGLTVETYSKSESALVVKRQLASRIFGGAIKPQLIFGYVDNGMIEQCNRRWRRHYVSHGASTQQG